jgi:hypothetical protein
MAVLTIHDLKGHVLAFDLRDLLRATAPLSLEATWTIEPPDASAFEATGVGGLRLEELAHSSARISGDELLALADNIVQVMWGDFLGTLPDYPHREWMTIRAVDSSFYVVETADEASITKIKSRFNDVRFARSAD